MATTPRGGLGESLGDLLREVKGKYGGRGSGEPLAFSDLFERLDPTAATAPPKNVSLRELVDRIIHRERRSWREGLVTSLRRRRKGSRIFGRRTTLSPYLVAEAPTPQRLYGAVARELQENAAEFGLSKSQVRKGLDYAAETLGTAKSAAAPPAVASVAAYLSGEVHLVSVASGLRRCGRTGGTR